MQGKQERRFGVEIEVSSTVPKSYLREIIELYTSRDVKVSTYGLSRNNKHWHIKSDATCGGRGKAHGWEICSFVGKDADDLLEIGEVVNGLRAAGIRTNQRCGLHVHVEVKDYSKRQMGVLLGHYVKAEWFLLGMLPPHRRNNFFAKPLVLYSKVNPFGVTTSQEYTYFCANDIRLPVLWLSSNGRRQKAVASGDSMWRCCKPVFTYLRQNPNRYQSINLVNFAYGLQHKKFNRKTVEFRLPDCLLKSEDIVNWIRLFRNFVNWAETLKDSELDFQKESMSRSLWHLGLDQASDLKQWALRRFITHESDNVMAKLILENDKKF